jgi:hypothetical protein
VSEDLLYDFMISRFCSDSRYSELPEFVRFEFLSVSSLENFVSSDFDSFAVLTSSIWQQLSRRLILSVSPQYSNDRLVKPRCEAFPSEGKSAFEGIFSYLSLKHGGNVHERGIVTVTAHEPYDSSSSWMPKNPADLTATTTSFCSKNAADQWLAYDFQKSRITPTAYSIRSFHNYQVNGQRLKSWVIEFSSDGSSWTEIDRGENNNDLNGISIVKTFSVSTSVECQIICLRQLGPNHYNDHCLLFSAFKIFGYLMESTN